MSLFQLSVTYYSQDQKIGDGIIVLFLGLVSRREHVLLISRRTTRHSWTSSPRSFFRSSSKDKTEKRPDRDEILYSLNSGQLDPRVLFTSTGLSFMYRGLSRYIQQLRKENSLLVQK